MQSEFCLALHPRCHTHHTRHTPSPPIQVSCSTATGVVCNCIASLACAIQSSLLPTCCCCPQSHWPLLGHLVPCLCPQFPYGTAATFAPPPLYPPFPAFLKTSFTALQSGWSSCFFPKASDSLPHLQTYAPFSHLFLLAVLACLSFPTFQRALLCRYP